MASSVPSSVVDAVLVQSTKMPEDTPRVHGYDFDKGVNLDALLESFLNTGFQATQFGRAVAEVRRMVRPVIARPLTFVHVG